MNEIDFSDLDNADFVRIYKMRFLCERISPDIDADQLLMANFSLNNNKHKLHELIDPNRVPVFFCLGLPYACYDCFGPICGTLLQNAGYIVYGTVNEPIYYDNYKLYYNESISIDSCAYQAICIDAAVFTDNRIDAFILSDCGIVGGSYFRDRGLPAIGEVGLQLNVNFLGLMSKFESYSENIDSMLSSNMDILLRDFCNDKALILLDTIEELNLRRNWYE